MFSPPQQSQYTNISKISPLTQQTLTDFQLNLYKPDRKRESGDRALHTPAAVAFLVADDDDDDDDDEE